MAATVHMYGLGLQWKAEGHRGAVCVLCGKGEGSEPTNEFWCHGTKVAQFDMEGHRGVYAWCRPDHPAIIAAEIHSS